MLSVTCPNCRKLLQVVETSSDRESQCSACGTTFWPADPTLAHMQALPPILLPAHRANLDARIVEADGVGHSQPPNQPPKSDGGDGKAMHLKAPSHAPALYDDTRSLIRSL